MVKCVDFKGASMSEKETSRALGFDPGTANLVCAWEDAGVVKVSRLRNVFFEIPVDEFSRKMLKQLNVPEFEVEGKLYLAGNEAFELAKTFGKELRRPMQSGVISSGEGAAIPMMTKMIERLCRESKVAKGAKCAYSMPADPVDQNFDGVFHKSVVESMIRRGGYEPHAVIEGHAVVLAELADSQFTGIGLSWGGGMVNCCVAYRSVPVISFSSARAGDWIDEKAAQACGMVKSRMTAVKEDPKFSLTGDVLTRDQAALASYYESAIQYTLTNIKKRFETGQDMPQFSEPVDIVCAGGTASPKGFVDVFKRVYDKMDFPIPVREIRVAEEPLYTVVRGCLVSGSL